MNVILNWTANPASEGVVKYLIFRAIFGQSASQIGEVLAPATSYTDQSVPTGKYTYTVKAQNLAGNSSPSIPATTPDAPSAPTDLTIQVTS